MSIESVRNYLSRWGRDGDILEMNLSTATVALAAEALGVIPDRIAKSICLQNGEGAVVVVTAGDARIDNKKFRERFGFKPRMLSPEDALRHTGHAVGGVCPFALPEHVHVYLDKSLSRFETVFPACGSANSAIELNMDELAEYADAIDWVDVCNTI